jgi:putative Mg2+ transporter-C (MgtC) family protein
LQLDPSGAGGRADPNGTPGDVPIVNDRLGLCDAVLAGLSSRQRPEGSLVERGNPVNTFQILPHLGALIAAYALAIPIGWDREKAERSAGLRTFPLVAIAACGFVQATETLLASEPAGQARIVEGVITGIGFIGGGAIIKHGTSVLGTATAASLWATGAVGVAVGLGSFDVAVVLSALTFLTLRFVAPLKGAAAKPEAENTSP